MSFLNVIPEAVTSAANDLKSIGSAVNAAHSAAAAPTTGAAAMAADEVSAAVQSAFATYARRYQAVSAQSEIYYARLVALVNSGAIAYAEAELANAQQTLGTDLASAAQPVRADVAAARQVARADMIAARRVARADVAVARREAVVAREDVAGAVNPLAERVLGRPLIATGNTSGTSGTSGTTGGGSGQGSGGNTTTTGGGGNSSGNGSVSANPGTTAPATKAEPATAAMPATSQTVAAATATAPDLSGAGAGVSAATVAAAGTGGSATLAGSQAVVSGAQAPLQASNSAGNALALSPGSGEYTATGSATNVTTAIGATGSATNVTTAIGATGANGSAGGSSLVTDAYARTLRTPLGPVQVTLDQSLTPGGAPAWSGSISVPPAVVDAVAALGPQASATAALHADVAAFTAAVQTGHPVAAVDTLLRAPGDVAHAYLYGQTAITEPLPAPTGYAEAYYTIPTGGVLSPARPLTVTLVPSTGSPTVVTLGGTETGGLATSLMG